MPGSRITTSLGAEGKFLKAPETELTKPRPAARWLLPAVIPFGAMAFILSLTLTPARSEGQIVGRASVVDGDTIDIRGERVRFNGVDAPESWQRCEDARGQKYRCGKAAAEALDAFLGQSRPTRCEVFNRDRYGRFIGDCYRSDGQSISRWLVSNGHALDWPKYSRGAFSAEMREAEQGGRGMWQGRFVEPWKARADRR